MKKAYTGMWIAYKRTLLTTESRYANLFFTKTNDDEARGFLIGEALRNCPKSDGWESHSCVFTEVSEDNLVLTLELVREND